MIQYLANKKDVMVLQADKGTAAVTMNTEEFTEKIRVMLSDKRVYKKV